MALFQKFNALAIKRGDGLRPEFEKLFTRMASGESCEMVVRHDGMLQSGPDPETGQPEAPRHPQALKKRV